MLGLIYNAMKLQSLMAWCNTIGGAHSSLGDSMNEHVSQYINYRHAHENSSLVFVAKVIHIASFCICTCTLKTCMQLAYIIVERIS